MDDMIIGTIYGGCLSLKRVITAIIFKEFIYFCLIFRIPIPGAIILFNYGIRVNEANIAEANVF